MKAYYGSRISPNQTETNEGYLIAHNVPIARTGVYEYLGSEIGADTNDIVKVNRDPEEVFSPAAMASFEGKPVVNDHPPIALSSDNAMDFSKGTVTNVRRGKGSDADLLLADLIIHDQRLIDAIRNGKREVSAGYDCDYVPNDDGTYSQKNIVGNHAAVVDAGRAGHRVRIQDRKSVDNDDFVDGRVCTSDADCDQYKNEDGTFKGGFDGAVKYFKCKGYSEEEAKGVAGKIAREKGKDSALKTKARDSGMTVIKKLLPRRRAVTDMLAAIGLKQVALDAEPDELNETVDALVDERHGARDEDEDTGREDGGKETEDDAEDQTRLKALEDQVAELKKALEESKKTADEKTAEETLDEELEKLDSEDDDDEEESKTLDPEEMTEDDPGPIAPEGDRPHSGITGDSAKRMVLQSIKPILATIPDEKTRRQVVDAAIASFKGRSGKNVYGQMARDTRSRVKQQQRQRQEAQAVDHSDLGMKIAQQWNPHYKKQQGQ